MAGSDKDKDAGVGSTPQPQARGSIRLSMISGNVVMSKNMGRVGVVVQVVACRVAMVIWDTDPCKHLVAMRFEELTVVADSRFGGQAHTRSLAADLVRALCVGRTGRVTETSKRLERIEGYLRRTINA